MKKTTNIRNIWIESFRLIVKKPAVIVPFFVIAFLETLMLELVYFSGRKPLSLIAAPIVRKFFGEGFAHYPYSLHVIPRIFNFLQILLYIFLGAALTAVSINIIKNVKSGLPLKPAALIKNALTRYAAFAGFGVIVVVALLILEKTGGFAFSKFAHLTVKYVPNVIMKLYPLLFAILMFLANTIIQTFLIATLPLMVMNKKSLLKALLESIVLAACNFRKFFVLVFLPFLIYFPITLLKGLSTQLADKVFPEITLLILLLGILATPFVECFLFTCVSMFLLEKGEHKEK